MILNHKVYQVNIFLLTFPDSSILSTSLLESETLFRVLLNASCFLSALTTAACLGARPYPKISYRRKTRSSLTQAANFHMAKVLWRSIRYSMQLEYPLIVRPSSTRFQAIRSIGLAAVRTGTNDLCPAVPCDGVKARRTVLYHGV